MNPLRICIVGAGLITQNIHLPWILATQGVDVHSIVDPVLDRAHKLAKSYGVRPRLATSVETVIDEIDAAVIATPNHTHLELALTCLERGVPIFVEKPLALNSAEGHEIVDCAKRQGLPVAVGYNTRFRANVRLLKTLLDDEYFGCVRRFVHQFGTRGGWAPLSAYNLSRDATGGGVLIVTGSHFLDRMLYFWGFPYELEFEDDSEGGPEANCRAFFRYTDTKSGFNGTAIYSKTVALPGKLIIETEHGIVELIDSDTAEIHFRRHEKPELVEIIRSSARSATDEGASPYQLQYEDFARSVRNGTSPLVDGQQGLQSLRLIEGLYAVRKQMKADWYSRTVTGESDE